jgi:hypothetical protein
MKISPKTKATILRVTRVAVSAFAIGGGLQMLDGTTPSTGTAWRSLGTGVLYAVVRLLFPATPGMEPVPTPDVPPAP